MDFWKLYILVLTAIGAGYLGASVLVETGTVNWLGLKTLRLSKAGIHPMLTSVPVLYLVSPRAGHLLASSLLREGKIGKFDLALAVLASNLPMRLMFLYRYYLPVLLPLVGVVALYYALLRLAFDLAVFLFVFITGSLYYKNRKRHTPLPGSAVLRLRWEAVKRGVRRGLREFFSFALKFTPLFLFVVAMMKAGVMDWLTLKLKPLFGGAGLDSLEVTYVTTCAVSPPVAYSLLKVMLKKGYPISHIVGTMAIGNAMFSLLRSWWAYLLPYYSGLYPARVVAMLLILQAGLPIVYNFTVGLILVSVPVR
jgi:hypothetical protein